MVDSNLYSVIEGAHVSEKASMIADSSRQFTFKVAKSATKPQIRRAVEEIFGVQVQSVKVLNVKGKRKGLMSRNPGRRAGWKKAYIGLKPGFDIDFSSPE
jgi:large subunit ribosomal protein L23